MVFSDCGETHIVSNCVFAMRVCMLLNILVDFCDTDWDILQTEFKSYLNIVSLKELRSDGYVMLWNSAAVVTMLILSVCLNKDARYYKTMFAHLLFVVLNEKTG